MIKWRSLRIFDINMAIRTLSITANQDSSEPCKLNAHDTDVWGMVINNSRPKERSFPSLPKYLRTPPAFTLGSSFLVTARQLSSLADHLTVFSSCIAQKQLSRLECHSNITRSFETNIYACTSPAAGIEFMKRNKFSCKQLDLE